MHDFKQRFISQLKRKEIASIPEVLAFNFMMALIPLLIVFFQILAYLSIETNLLDETIAQYVPKQVYTFLMDFLATASIQFSHHPVLLAVSIGTLILTVSKGVNGIFKAFAITYMGQEDQPLYKRRLKAILTFFLLLTFVSLSLIIILASHRLLVNFPPLVQKVTELAIFMIFCTLFFFLLFLITIPKTNPSSQVVPGAMATSVGFTVTSLVFSFYVDQLANFHLIYGSLTTIIVLFFWLYLISFMINVGIQINYVLNQLKQQNKWWKPE